MNYAYAIVFSSIVVWLPWFWRYHIQSHWERKRLRLNLKNHPQQQRYIITERLLKMIYRGVLSRRVSRKEQRRLNKKNDNFVYGEIECLSFVSLLEIVQPQLSDVFYDWGSGAGKAVLTAALNFDLARSVGVELLPGLCELANQQTLKARVLVQTFDASYADIYARRLACVQFINDDFLHCDLSSCDILFINATCLGPVIWAKILEKIVVLRTGSRVIITSKKILIEQFQCIYTGRELMSWGINSVHIYERL